MNAALAKPIRLGLHANVGQFALLVLVNAFVGAMVGMERSILPAIAEQEFHLLAHSAILSFIVVFGLSKALTNYFAGRWSERFGRKTLLVAGWLIAVPVPFLLMWAPNWNWILGANLLLGISQGLTWSTTVIMKIDLVGPARRGMAMGFNEFAGYVAVALSAWGTGWIASQSHLRPEPFYLGVVYVLLGLLLSRFAVRETLGHAQLEARTHPQPSEPALGAGAIFWRTTLKDRNLSSVTQAGFVNNLNDGMAWGLFPLFFAQVGKLNLATIATLAAIYPLVWGLGQLWTGHWSDSIGRKPLIVGGMLIQGLGLVAIVLWPVYASFVAGSVLLGLGTAMVYPTLLAAIGDVAHPGWRASAVGIYRLWRDGGYAVGALVAGLTADWLGLSAAIWLVAGLTMLSGLIAALRMQETLQKSS
ncbi:MAG: MFS transporter [Candidatus Sericytochromatia bacterium]